MLRQTSLLNRVCYINTTRQTLLPFSTSVRNPAESTNEPPTGNTTNNKAFDSVPVHISSAGKLVMVLGGLYKRVNDVPDTIPNRVYQKTKDKFRARCVIFSVFATALLSIIAAMRGKSAHREGKRFTDDIYKMHRGESRLHEQLESLHQHRNPAERYSPLVDEINK